MLDTLTLKAAIRPYNPNDLERFDQIAFLRNSAIKTKATTNFVDSPLTGAQFEVLPAVEEWHGEPWLFLTVTIPVAAVFVGQNMIHGGLDIVELELKCVRALLRWTLASFGFNPEDIGHYLKNARIETGELTWHTATTTRKAARNAQARTIAHFSALEKIKSRHDVQVQDVDIWTRNDHTCLLVTFKDGSQFRQYIKAEQAASRTKNNRRASFVSKDVRPHLPVILNAIDTHLRNEVLPSRKLLEDHNLLLPKSWTPVALESVISAVLNMGRLSQRRVTKYSELDRSGLSAEVLSTAESYFAGVALETVMSPQLFSKHRNILSSKGLEIGGKLGSSRSKLTSRGGLQLQYSNRWIPDADLSKFAVGESNAAGIVAAIKNAPLGRGSSAPADEGDSA